MQKDEAILKLKEFKEKNGDHYKIEQIGIFGSLARGEAKDDSDIDICLKTKVADMFMLVHLKDDLSKLFSKSVDIVRVREKMNPFLKNRIDKEAIYV
ncbi:nucleotidyltransferase family protein [Arcobacter sp. FWKO B]|uniref:nucleotidyltransferase family protein n=1 Tax=Arcobacter sp. FWKO B TaxID=2593672 RepID=UPI0018A39DE9|nr:nucleotidyltransferase domain-containing protein [Arcobacter sp. FWKO B]QOG11281.1 nucleotidyltransferase [Arcobacter sp. FWKO B]